LRGGRYRLGCRGFSGSTALIDGEDFGPDRHGRPFLYLQFPDHARYRRRYFGVYFVGDNFGNRLVLFDRVAGLL
jgi:hypothetical protein